MDLRCADDSLYTGITTDLGRRCQQHNAGTASRYTRGRRPIHLAYQEQAPIKALTRREKESMILCHG
jgi:predicted GIY-YIG superfamily endonuclease